MKRVLMITGAALLLSACGSSAEKKLHSDCTQVMKDVEATSFLDDLGTDSKGMCDCMVKTIATGTKEQQAQSQMAFDRIVKGMEESGQGVEDVVDELTLGALEGAAQFDEDIQDVAAGIDLVDDYFDAIGEGFETAQTCPIS